MDVQLYVYDLSGGLAKHYSLAITGVQIDAIYHTAVVFGGVEYFFGQGIHRKIPGSTHHGRPMQILPMGKTELPMELIEEYIQSLEAIYTPESYDLFLHNCNNFSQDLCMFLVGKNIPEVISTLPETFLRTPIGQMLRGQIDQSMRQMTQAPDAVSGQNARRLSQSRPVPTNGESHRYISDRPTFTNGVPQKRTDQNGSKHIHSHEKLKLKTFEKRIGEPVLAKTCPPLDKLLAKIMAGAEPNTATPLQELADHVKARELHGGINAPVPNLRIICDWVKDNFATRQPSQFAIVDLLRISAIDPRVSAFLATESDLSTLELIFKDQSEEIPYNLHFTRIQLAMNLFSSPVVQEATCQPQNKLRNVLGGVAVAGLLASNSKLRFQAGSLVINLVALDHNQRLDGLPDLVDISSIANGEIESALVQAVLDDEPTNSRDTFGRLIHTLGLLLYRAPDDSVKELCEAMDVADFLQHNSKLAAGEPVTKEVLQLLKTG